MVAFRLVGMQPRNVEIVQLKWLLTKGRNSRTSGLYYTCIYEAVVHTVQGVETEGKPLWSIQLCLELSLLDVKLNVRFKRRAGDVSAV